MIRKTEKDASIVGGEVTAANRTKDPQGEMQSLGQGMPEMWEKRSLHEEV